MEITSLECKCDNKGGTQINVWAKCHSVEDVDDIIAWLHLAKTLMKGWDKIEKKRATLHKEMT